MNALKTMRRAGEVALVRLGMATVPFFPRRLLLGLARLAGTLGYALARKSRRIALANLDLAFRDSLAPAEKRRIARQSFATMARTALDMLWFTRHTRRRLARHLVFDPGFSRHVYTAPMIGVTAHFGSWELLGRGLIAKGYPHAAVAAPLINPGVERLFNRSRLASGMEIIPQAGALRGVLKALRQKKHVALVLDQNVKPEDGGVFVDFFGLPVPMSGAAAMFAERTGVPVVLFFCLARPDGGYYVYALPPLKSEAFAGPDGSGRSAPAETDGIRAMTQAVAALFEQEIRKHPGQWLWMYKRWKHVPPGRPPADYPFYAKPANAGLVRNPIKNSE